MPTATGGKQAVHRRSGPKVVRLLAVLAGRKLGYPPKPLEQVRRLIEQRRVAFLFEMLGTAPNNAAVAQQAR